MYKNIIAAALLSCGHLGAQTDTSLINIRQENTPYVQPAYTDADQAIFRSLEPARFLLKWNALALWPTGNLAADASVLATDIPTPNPRGLRLEVAAETKITPWLSINITGSCLSGRIAPDLFLYDYVPNPLTYAQLRVEPRVYFDMPGRIRKGRNANNFSGNYFGLEVSQAELFGQTGEVHVLPERERTAALRFGVQRRLFRYGYFDVSYGLGWRNWEQKLIYEPTPRQEFFVNSRVAIGLAFASGGTRKASQSTSSWCDFARCFREEDQVWRIDLLNALVIDNIQEIRGELPIAYEKKIGGSPFSLESEVRLLYGHAHTRGSIYMYYGHVNWIGAALALEPRFYFTLKKRIAQGRSGNNLSGPFLALRLQAQLEQARLSSQSAFRQATTQAVALPLAGVQYRFLRNGFIAYKIGAGAALARVSGYYTIPTRQMHLNWLSELKAGLAF